MDIYLYIIINYETRRTLDTSRDSLTLDINRDYDSDTPASSSRRLTRINRVSLSFVITTFIEKVLRWQASSHTAKFDVFARVSRLSGLHDEPFVIENPWHQNCSRTRTNHHRRPVSVRAMASSFSQ